MIRNVLGKAVTKSTLISHREYEGDSKISREDMARAALELKSSQGKGKEEEEAIRQMENLKAQCAKKGGGLTLGWIYNASGGAITLVDGCNWNGELVSSSLYPVRIENGQWGMFLHKQCHFGVSSAAILYEGSDFDGKTCYWSVAWSLTCSSRGQVHVNIATDVDWCKNGLNNVHKALDKVSGLQHGAKREGWLSAISASPGPDAVLEALLTLEHL